jgi:Haem-NO-binding
VHGVIFTSFRDFALARFGPDAVKEIFTGRPFHVVSEAYDDEDRIHELVRATIPDARPPQLVVEPRNADGVRITYRSPRRLCVLLAGLLHGTATYYGESVDYEQKACMHRGDDACVFDVIVNGPAPAA